MEKVRYMISDASNRIQVEAHVLRYWEEELELDVPRNEMGHRYYTEENIRQFEEIKRLKEEGFQLKAIKMLLHNSSSMADEVVSEEEGEALAREVASAENMEISCDQSCSLQEQEVQPANLSKLEQFQLMMNEIVRNAIAENNQALGNEVSSQVGEKVLKEMNYLMRDREEQEEERFRKLDESIRNHQRRPGRARAARKEAREKKIRFKARESVS